ncbi:MAG: nitroreductase family protein [Slackia sp.]
MQAIEERHAVRSYRDKPLSHVVVAHLKEVITRCNTEGDLRQLVRECPSAFAVRLVRHVQGRT